MDSIQEMVKYLTESAKSRNMIIKSLTDTEEQRILNLMQIFLFRDTTTVHHWISELYACCHKIEKTKVSHKYLDEDTIFEEIFLSWSDSYDDWHEMLCDNVHRKESMIIPQHDKVNLYNFMRDYHKWLAHQLSMKGSILFKGCEETIRKLLDTYPLL